MVATDDRSAATGHRRPQLLRPCPRLSGAHPTTFPTVIHSNAQNSPLRVAVPDGRNRAVSSCAWPSESPRCSCCCSLVQLRSLVGRCETVAKEMMSASTAVAVVAPVAAAVRRYCRTMMVPVQTAIVPRMSPVAERGSGLNTPTARWAGGEAGTTKGGFAARHAFGG